MNEQLKDWKIIKVLNNDFVICNNTHEHAPPHKDCADCGVSMEAQISASNPFMSPMRSGGKKHKKCMDCWNKYIYNLSAQIHDLYKEDGYVQLDEDQSLPPNDENEIMNTSPKRVCADTQQSMLRAGFRKVKA